MNGEANVLIVLLSHDADVSEAIEKIVDIENVVMVGLKDKIAFLPDDEKWESFERDVNKNDTV